MSLDATEAIVVKLRTTTAVTAKVAGGASGIALGLLPAGTVTPYVEVLDAGGVPSYSFGNAEAYSSELFDIYVYAEDTSTKSAQTVAKELLQAIRDALHNQELTFGSRRFECLRAGGDRPSTWSVRSSQERFFRAGLQFEAMTGEA